MNEEEELNEAYQKLLEKLRKADRERTELKKELEEVKQQLVKKEVEETSGEEIRGYCSRCGQTLTRKDIDSERCPACGSTQFYST